MQALDVLQAASNAVAGNVTGPVDILSLLLRKIGVPVPENALGSSQWAREHGLLRDVDDPYARAAGESLGIIAPMVAAAKAPQIARGLLKAGDNLAAPRTLDPQTGAIVWHGSPHKFDKFDSAHIGKGEGAQAYGHGLYLADSPDVADEYAGKLSRKIVDFANKTPTSAAEKRLAARLDRLANTTQYGSVLGQVQNAYNRALMPSRDSMYGNAFVGIKPMSSRRLGETLAMQRAATRLGAPDVGDAGNLYKVDLPDSAIARMLDWDKPLSQQPAVLKALERHPTMGKNSIGWRGAPEGMWERAMSSPSRTGEWLYRELGENSAAQTEAAKAAGIPGIRYLDGGSRGAGSGTSNYVVFPGEEALLTILERNGIPLP